MKPANALKTSLAAFAALALLAAGCGDSGDDSSSTTASATTSSSSAGAAGTATIDVADNDALGQILTDADGNTVYLFEKDESGKSECSGQCATVWSPVTSSGKPTAGDGADASLISTVARADGTQQVTYDGHPLYRYQGDTSPGDTNGNELYQFCAEWYALTPDGSNAEGSGEESSSGSDESTDSTSEDSTDSSSGSGSGSADYGY